MNRKKKGFEAIFRECGSFWSGALIGFYEYGLHSSGRGKSNGTKRRALYEVYHSLRPSFEGGLQ